jgi:Uncharacterized protein conserved in bacteria
MRSLLDSHVFVWMHDAPHKLSLKASNEIADPVNQIFLSVVSAWELQIKIKLGKFSFSNSLENVIAQQRKINSLQILPVELSHALYVENLPLHHKDPFDRLLIAQATTENMTLVSADKHFTDYSGALLW